MRTIAVTNQKGGSGKTTTTVNLAAALGEKGKRILVIDLDPQMSATSWLGINGADEGIYRVLVANGNLTDVIINTDVLGVSLAPASSWLVGADKRLAGEVGAETILHRSIEAVSKAYDFCLIDCPPALGILSINALVAAREVLVPVEAHVMALSGLAQLTNTVDTVRDRLNARLQISGILPCRVDGRNRHCAEVVDQIRGHFGQLVYNTVIRENVRLAEAPSFGQPITLYDPRSNGAADYRALAEEVITRKGRG